MSCLAETVSMMPSKEPATACSALLSSVWTVDSCAALIRHNGCHYLSVDKCEVYMGVHAV